MWSYLFLVLLRAAIVFAQQSYGNLPDSPVSYAFEFHGCAAVDLNGFGDPIVFLDGVITPERCQAACRGQLIAALFAHSCRCGNDMGSFTPLASSACDNPCMGDPDIGICGSTCPKKGQEISTIYITKDKSDFKEPLDQSSSSSVEISHTGSIHSSTESSTGTPTLLSISPDNDSSSWVKSTLISATPSPVAVPWPSAILLVDPPTSQREGNLDSSDPDPTARIPGRGFRPIGSNATVLKSSERDGDPPVPALVPKSQAHTPQQQFLSALGGLAILFTILT